jgi:hypothetical protein
MLVPGIPIRDHSSGSSAYSGFVPTVTDLTAPFEANARRVAARIDGSMRTREALESTLGRSLEDLVTGALADGHVFSGEEQTALEELFDEPLECVRIGQTE